MLGVLPLTDRAEPVHLVAPIFDTSYNDELIGGTISVGVGKGSLGYLYTLFTALEVYRGQVGAFHLA